MVLLSHHYCVLYVDYLNSCHKDTEKYVLPKKVILRYDEVANHCN